MAKSNAGRPRLSKEEKIKHGTIRTSRERAYQRAEMKVLPLTEYPPALGDLKEEGKKLWNAVVRELMDLGVLSSLDLFLLQALCIEWEAYLQHRREQSEKNPGTGSREQMESSARRYRTPYITTVRTI